MIVLCGEQERLCAFNQYLMYLDGHPSPSCFFLVPHCISFLQAHHLCSTLLSPLYLINFSHLTWLPPLWLCFTFITLLYFKFTATLHHFALHFLLFKNLVCSPVVKTVSTPAHMWSKLIFSVLSLSTTFTTFLHFHSQILATLVPKICCSILKLLPFTLHLFLAFQL